MLARLALGRDLLGLVDDHVHVFVEALMKFFFEMFLREFERGGLIGERAREGGARDAVEEESEAAAGRERASEEVERERRSKKRKRCRRLFDRERWKFNKRETLTIISPSIRKSACSYSQI